MGITLLGLIHFDICGPTHTQTQGDVWYFVLFIDDISIYIQASLIKKNHKYHMILQGNFLPFVHQRKMVLLNINTNFI
jgi:hypothetical protein